MLDIALLTANASQLKYILQVGHKHEFYTLMLGLISTSLILQVFVIYVLFLCCLTFIASRVPGYCLFIGVGWDSVTFFKFHERLSITLTGVQNLSHIYQLHYNWSFGCYNRHQLAHQCFWSLPRKIRIFAWFEQQWAKTFPKTWIFASWQYFPDKRD